MENSNLCCPEVNANTKLLNAETKADDEGRSTLEHISADGGGVFFQIGFVIFKSRKSGEMIQLAENSFKMGWFNHQLVWCLGRFRGFWMSGDLF